jgi:hypothetical protein
VVEVLRGLDDPDAGVIEVGERLVEEVGPRNEVGVDHDDELTVGAVEGRDEIAGLLPLPAVGSDGVAQPVTLSELPYPFLVGVVEDVHAKDPVPTQARQPVEGVLEHLEVLAAARKEDVDRRSMGGLPGRHQHAMALEGRAPRLQAEPEVDEHRRQHERQEHQADGGVHIAAQDEDEAARRDRLRGEQPQERPSSVARRQVAVALLVGRRRGQRRALQQPKRLLDRPEPRRRHGRRRRGQDEEQIAGRHVASADERAQRTDHQGPAGRAASRCLPRRNRN